jgi:hypothetical protein
LPPGETVWLDGEAAIEKSGLDAAARTAYDTVPKTTRTPSSVSPNFRLALFVVLLKRVLT